MVENRNQNVTATKSGHGSFELDALLHPANAFKHPMDVVRDCDLTSNEKRAILASWASDACAVEAMPDLRSSTSGPVVAFDDIMEALRALDGQQTERPKYHKLISRARRVKELYRGGGGERSLFG